MEEPGVKFLSESQIASVAAEAFAREIADQAQALQEIARNAGFVLTIENVADEFGVVIVQARNPHAAALRLAVPA